MKSARMDSEGFFVKTRLGKRRSTLCTSSFSNRRIGGKEPLSTEEDFIGVSQNHQKRVPAPPCDAPEELVCAPLPLSLSLGRAVRVTVW